MIRSLHRLCGGRADRGHRLHIRAEADLDWNCRASCSSVYHPTIQSLTFMNRGIALPQQLSGF
jgi:hypothetical protein